MGTEAGLIKQESQDAFQAVLIVGKEAAGQLAEARAAMDPVAESMAMAFGIAALQDSIRANPQAIAVLQRMGGHKWGFKTDRDDYNGGGTLYKPDILVPCFCEAMMNQLRPVGNEFNIITASMYVTKEGWAGLLSRLPGVTEVDSRPGAIIDYDVRDFVTKKGDTKKKITASVSATADCNVWGQNVQVRAWKTADADERLQLSVIADEIDEALDQLKGKADARILERLHQKVKALSLAGPQGVPQAEPKQLAIEAPKPPVEQDTTTDAERDMLAWQQSRDGLNRMLSSNPSEAATVMELWDAIGSAKAMADHEACGQRVRDLKPRPSTRVLDELRRWGAFCQQQMKAET